MLATDLTKPLMPEQVPTLELSIFGNLQCGLAGMPASPLLSPGQAIQDYM